MIKIPYGESHFPTVIKDGYYYVDRTSYIQSLEDGSKYVFFLRPRRFGKSLFVSMLQNYYGVECAENFQQLFGNLYIGKHPTPKANRYLVLSFEFSRINTDTWEHTYNGFLSNVRAGVRSFMMMYSTYFTENEIEKTIQKEEPNEIVKELFSLHKDKKIPVAIYVLIDEYDHFTNELISFQHDTFKNIVSKNGFVRKFFESIKTASGDGTVERLFVTGVSPVTLDSLTSGFNIAENASLSYDLHAMMGFNESEVVEILKGIDTPKDDFDKVLTDLRSWYNGYLFNGEAQSRVYNPDMVLYFAREYQKNQKYPRTLLDSNIASDYSKIRNLFKIQDKERDRLSIINALTETGEVSAQLTDQFSFEREFTDDDLVSLLFYMGFLTIKNLRLGQSYNFTFPNFVIERLYKDYFLNTLQRNASLPVDNAPLKRALLSLAETGSLDLFIIEANRILKGLSNRDNRDFREISVKAIVVALFWQQGFYHIHSEYETEKSYTDIYLQAIRGYNVPYEAVFELKYLSNKEADKQETVFNTAEKQLKGYLATKKFNSTSRLKAFVLICVGDELKYREV